MRSAVPTLMALSATLKAGEAGTAPMHRGEIDGVAVPDAVDHVADRAAAGQSGNSQVRRRPPRERLGERHGYRSGKEDGQSLERSTRLSIAELAKFAATWPADA